MTPTLARPFLLRSISHAAPAALLVVCAARRDHPPQLAWVSTMVREQPPTTLPGAALGSPPVGRRPLCQQPQQIAAEGGGGDCCCCRDHSRFLSCPSSFLLVDRLLLDDIRAALSVVINGTLLISPRSSPVDIFLMTAIMDERLAGHSAADAVDLGLQRSGPVISWVRRRLLRLPRSVVAQRQPLQPSLLLLCSCLHYWLLSSRITAQMAPVASQHLSQAGAIMAIAFSGLLFSHVPLVSQVGFMVVFAVLLDSFVVRPLLVPSCMHLLGELAYWPQRMPLLPPPPPPAAAAATMGDEEEGTKRKQEKCGDGEGGGGGRGRGAEEGGQ